MRKITIPYTTDAAGAAVEAAPAVLAELYAIEYQPGTTDTGATLTVTCENGVYSKPLLTLASAGTSNLILYPRDLVHAVANGAALTGTAGGDRAKPLMSGKPTVTITSGGDTLSGKVIIYYEV